MGPTWHRLIFQFGSRTRTKPFSDAHLPRSGPHFTGGGSFPSTRISSTSYMMHQFQAPKTIKSFSAHASSGNGYDENHSTGSVESADEFEQRIFGGNSRSSPNSDAFFRKLDELEKARNKSGDRNHGGSGSSILDGLEDSFSTLSDGMDGKLKKAATYFEFDEEEILQDDYTFRPDMKFWRGMTYNVKDLDLTKTRVSKPPKRQGFEVTTEEVLSKADFRNVKFLANFITESGIIIKRSQTRISAKAQRKVAREIKTARAFGLMPFTTMGTKSFVYGKTMEDLDEDYEYENFDSQVVADENE